MDASAYAILFAGFAFALGAVVGSFLNVCIYRLPLDLSVNEPRRSFCPHCKKQIPWSQNIPLVSWLALRGRCANCKAPIAFRYFGVELLTGVLFLAAWLRCWRAEQFSLVLPLWIILGLMVVATFIDFEHFIIPDEITLGGVVAGVVCSLLFPALMDQQTHLLGLVWSLGGAAVGYGVLWLVVEAGKLAFGRKKIALAKPEPFTWVRQGDDATLSAGGDVMKWSDLFSRPGDRLLLHVTEARAGGKGYGETKLTFHYDKLAVEGDTYELDKLDEIDGVVTGLVIPREAMGFGDVKFIAGIGAFLGAKAVLFIVVSASVIGAIVGVLMIAIGKREWSGRIPFGPYLALGAVIWIFYGPALLNAYLAWIAPGG